VTPCQWHKQDRCSIVSRPRPSLKENNTALYECHRGSSCYLIDRDGVLYSARKAGARVRPGVRRRRRNAGNKNVNDSRRCAHTDSRNLDDVVPLTHRPDMHTRSETRSLQCRNHFAALVRWRGICYGDVAVCVVVTLVYCAQTTEPIIMRL